MRMEQWIWVVAGKWGKVVVGFEYVVKEVTGFTDETTCGVKRRMELKMAPSYLVWAAGKVELSLSEKKTSAERAAGLG